MLNKALVCQISCKETRYVVDSLRLASIYNTLIVRTSAVVRMTVLHIKMHVHALLSASQSSNFLLSIAYVYVKTVNFLHTCLPPS